MSYSDLPLFSLCKELSFLETNNFLFTHVFHQIICYLMEVYNYCNNAHNSAVGEVWTERERERTVELANRTAGCGEISALSKENGRNWRRGEPLRLVKRTPVTYEKKPVVVLRAGF